MIINNVHSTIVYRFYVQSKPVSQSFLEFVKRNWKNKKFYGCAVPDQTWDIHWYEFEWMTSSSDKPTTESASDHLSMRILMICGIDQTQKQWNLITQCQTFIITSINFMVFNSIKCSCENSFPKLFMHPRTCALPYTYAYWQAVSTEKEQNQVNIINILTCWWSFCLLWILYNSALRNNNRKTQKKIVAGTNGKVFCVRKFILRTLIIILAM